MPPRSGGYGPKLNIIFVTGFSDYKADAMDMRASGYIMKPVHFDRSRAKEIFAYLVHRHGSSCSSREIAAALFEDEPYDKSRQSYLQTLIVSMMKSLKAVGAEEAIHKDYNSLSVNTKVLDCDYYRFAELDAGAVNAYANEYMSQYYWADFMMDDY